MNDKLHQNLTIITIVFMSPNAEVARKLMKKSFQLGAQVIEGMCEEFHKSLPAQLPITVISATYTEEYDDECRAINKEDDLICAAFTDQKPGRHRKISFELLQLNTGKRRAFEIKRYKNGFWYGIYHEYDIGKEPTSSGIIKCNVAETDLLR